MTRLLVLLILVACYRIWSSWQECQEAKLDPYWALLWLHPWRELNRIFRYPDSAVTYLDARQTNVAHWLKLARSFCCW